MRPAGLCSPGAELNSSFPPGFFSPSPTPFPGEATPRTHTPASPTPLLRTRGTAAPRRRPGRTLPGGPAGGCSRQAQRDGPAPVRLGSGRPVSSSKARRAAGRAEPFRPPGARQRPPSPLPLSPAGRARRPAPPLPSPQPGAAARDRARPPLRAAALCSALPADLLGEGAALGHGALPGSARPLLGAGGAGEPGTGAVMLGGGAHSRGAAGPAPTLGARRARPPPPPLPGSVRSSQTYGGAGGRGATREDRGRSPVHPRGRARGPRGGLGQRAGLHLPAPGPASPSACRHSSIELALAAAAPLYPRL